MTIKTSELILNPDGSVYHLNLKPENIAKTIILVGDQDRVEKVTSYFDTIEFSTQKREFKTQTGFYKGKRLSVISTGIGPDNIDIVLNEIDALFNIDLITRQPKTNITSLDFIRIGTSGALQSDIPVDGFVLSTHGLDLNGMLHAYKLNGITNEIIEDAFIKHTQWHPDKSRPLIIENSKSLQLELDDVSVYKGITATAGGFYGPQGRVLRLALQDETLKNKMDSFKFKDYRITNLEMETSAIYGLSKLLGHRAVSLNAIIANRASGTFSKEPSKTIENLIEYTLNKITE
ncbi:nucleoside phosphorylase [Siansivirga zeaxanthinifaciens]|uniref:Uridine phosphorylase n=1 Tax=Siansivirga zeaxanthinifaciens CC-SAMT-1 TaxID=1454006 RepID=A0A0C5WAT1_9FLAO|nr:nucleoside phosphorylase [Siansivirga zeaxanthinifaciens]AJR04203.1 phosphorylase [Siansivirga zeaxanthinifaciens CC-SAMT-1]